MPALIQTDTPKVTVLQCTCPWAPCLTVRLTAFTKTRPGVIALRARDQMKWQSARSRSAGDHTSTTITRNPFARVAATNLAAFRSFTPPPPVATRRRGVSFFLSALIPLVVHFPGLLRLVKGQVAHAHTRRLLLCISIPTKSKTPFLRKSSANLQTREAHLSMSNSSRTNTRANSRPA